MHHNHTRGHSTSLRSPEYRTLTTPLPPAGSLRNLEHRVANLTTLPANVQYLIFGLLSDKSGLPSLIKSHPNFKEEARRYLFRSVTLPIQSTLANPIVSSELLQTPQHTGRDGWRRQQSGSWVQLLPNPAPWWGTSTSAEGRDWEQRTSNTPSGPNDTPVILLPMTITNHGRLFGKAPRYPQIIARQHTYQLFLQALEGTPQLAEYVRTVHLDREWGAPLFLNTQSFQIMAKLFNLQQTTVTVKDRLSGPHFQKLQQDCMQQLWFMLRDSKATKVTLLTPTLKALSKLMQLPLLTTFVVETFHSWKEHPGVDLGPLQYVESNWVEPIFLDNLKSIDLGSFALLPVTIQKLLAHTRNLESIAITTRSLRALPATDSELGEHIVEFLKHAQGKLEKLSLCKSSFTDFSTQNFDLSKADFTDFKHLKTLSVTSSLWFNAFTRIGDAPDTGFVWKQEVRKAACAAIRLPTSLRELEIRFNLSQCVFATGINYHAQFACLPNALQLSSCDWILDLAQNLGSRLKCLRLTEALWPTLRVDHDPDRAERTRVATNAYNVPSAVNEVFDQSNMRLEIMLLDL